MRLLRRMGRIRDCGHRTALLVQEEYELQRQGTVAHTQVQVLQTQQGRDRTCGPVDNPKCVESR